MNSVNSIKVVCFDLDDTICSLWDGEKKAKQTLINRIHKKSDYPHDMLTQIYDQEWTRVKNRYMDLVSQGFDELDIREKHITKVLDLIGYRTDPHQYAETHCTVSMDGINIYPDAKKVLEALGEKYRLTMITNGASVWQREKIMKLDLSEYFEEIIISGELGQHKPSEKIFHEMTSRTVVNPHEIIYIGNHFRKDILGANNAGWRTVFVNRRNEERDDVPDYVINELSELHKIL